MHSIQHASVRSISVVHTGFFRQRRRLSAIGLVVTGAVLLLVAFPGASRAQAQAAASAADQAQTAAPAGATTLQEVVVTAERRETDIQKTPVAVTAVSQNALANSGVQQLMDISKIVPDVRFTGGGEGSTVQVRGVSSADTSPTSESAVATYVNGVELAKQRGLDGFLFDLQRIEIDKGPQGTLFGKDTNGGAINIITNRPVVGQTSGEGEVELGSYELVRTAGYLNLPLGDNFAARLAIQTDKHNGYFASGAGDLNLNAARLSLLWRITNRDTFFIVGDESIDTSIDDSPVANIIAVEPGVTNIYVEPNVWQDQFYHGNQFSNFPRYNFRTLVNGLTAENDYNFNWATWTTLLSHRHMNQNPNMSPGAPTPAAPPIVLGGRSYMGYGFSYVPQHFHSYSAETRLTSTATTPFQWVVGLYWDQETDGGTMIQYAHLTDPPVPSVEIAQPYQQARTYAVYGQVTYTPAALARLHLTAGGRANRDIKSIKDIFTRFGPSTAPYNAFIPFASNRWDATTYKGEISFDLTANSLLYVDTATGFESGGYGYGPGVNPAVGPVYAPEEITAYEAGSKNRFLNNTLQVNVEAWYYHYKNFLGNLLLYQCKPPNGCGGQPIITIESVGAANYRGATASIDWLFTPADEFNASFSWQNDRYSQYEFFAPAGGGYSLQPTGNAPPVLSQSNLSYTPINGIPKWTGNVSYQHHFTFSSGTFTAQVLSQLRGPVVLNNTVDPVYGSIIINGKSFAMFDVNLTYQHNSSPWSVTAYVRNVADSLEPLAETESTQTHSISYTPYPPRLIGVIVRDSF